MPYKASFLEVEDKEKQWEMGCLGDSDPETLLHTVWFLTTKLLSFSGCQEDRQLTWGVFSPVHDKDSAFLYLQWTERQTKTRNGSTRSSERAFPHQIFTNRTKPDSCPINAILAYEEHRPVEMNLPDSPFYLAINYNRPNLSLKWYKKKQLAMIGLVP